jgi:hypothetical protein
MGQVQCSCDGKTNESHDSEAEFINYVPAPSCSVDERSASKHRTIHCFGSAV